MKRERERESILETWALVEIEDWMDWKRSLLQRALVGIVHRTWVAREFGCNGLGLKLRTRWFEREFNANLGFWLKLRMGWKRVRSCNPGFWLKMWTGWGGLKRECGCNGPFGWSCGLHEN
jgi:hypothetical protein